jgi:hypothetical protein
MTRREGRASGAVFASSAHREASRGLPGKVRSGPSRKHLAPRDVGITELAATELARTDLGPTHVAPRDPAPEGLVPGLALVVGAPA